MDGLLSGVLPAVYSASDRLKRNVNSLLSDPKGWLESKGQTMATDAAAARGLLSAAVDEDLAAQKQGKGLMTFGPANQRAAQAIADAYNVGAMTVNYPQAQALETARKNATKMLGLPPNNTAMDRARALGFYDGWLHGSPNPDIRAFDPKLAGQRGVDFGPATFATKNGDNASGYSLNWDSYKAVKDADPVVAKANAAKNEALKNYAEAFGKGEHAQAAAIKKSLGVLYQPERELYNKFMDYGVPAEGSTVYPLMIRADRMPWVDGAGQNFKQVNGPAIAAAREAGAPGVRINSVADNAGRFNGTSDVMAVFEPSHIRSRFAAFDPARVNENDLLGRADPTLLGLLGLGAGGAAYLTRDKKDAK